MEDVKVGNKITIFLTIVLLCLILVGCSEADKVSSNISNEADNFNVERRLVVINNMTDTIQFEMTGLMSIREDGSQLEITVKHDGNIYKKHFVGMSEFTTYICEDTTGSDVSTRNYTLNFNPDMLTPFETKNYNKDNSK